MSNRPGRQSTAYCRRTGPTRLGPVSFLNTTTVFGTPNDVTLAELTLEMLFPADDQTIEIVKAMVWEMAALT